MTKNIYHFMPGLLAVVLIAGCGQSEFPAGKVHTPLNDPCAMVLMPFSTTGSAAPSGTDKSIKRYQKAVSHTPESVPRLERLGWAFVEKAREIRDTGYYKLAEQTALCIEKQAPDSVESLLLLGHVLHNLHRFREAEDLARRLVRQRGLWFDYALLGDVLVERGALNEAIDAYQMVIDQRPGPQAYLRIARLRWLKGDLDGSLEMMSQAVRSTSPRTPEAAAWAHVRLALLLMQVDEFASADTVLTGALSLKPGYPPALHARGRLLLAENRPLDAVPVLMQAVQADPLPAFRWTLYEALQAAGKQGAASTQEAALRKHGAVEDRRTYSLFLATVGDDPETALHLALQELEQREDVFTLDAVAWALNAVKRNAEALDYSRRALAEGTQDARLYWHAGVIAARTGDSERSFELLSKARSTQQTLLPSEQQQLANEFAALQPRIPTLVYGYPQRPEPIDF